MTRYGEGRVRGSARRKSSPLTRLAPSALATLSPQTAGRGNRPSSPLALIRLHTDRLSRDYSHRWPSPGSLRRDDASHHMIGREVAGGFLADFDLQRRVPDAEALPQLARRHSQEFVAGMAAGKTRCAVRALSVVLKGQICRSCTATTPAQDAR